MTSNPARSPWRWLALGLVIIYVRGLFIDLMDVDASQYASIAMEMLQTGDWLHVHYRSADYLDKPPLLFWTSATSFALFGLHVWAYKLPSVLGTVAGIYATWRFCLLHYSRATARNASFILASSVGAVLMSNDVRTDALLFGMTTCAIWQCAEYIATRKMRHVLLVGLFVGLAMLAKGPIGAVVPAFAVGTHVLLKRDWRAMLDWRWIVAFLVTACVIMPMCIGLYQQFDLHPEIIVNGQRGVSGLRFFFWDQSFGRITGISTWKNDTSVFTFVHVYLWIFLPWTLLFVAALCRRIADVVRCRFAMATADEGYSLGGFVLTFIALSLSHYRLPHYVFITLPWAAVLTARWMESIVAAGVAGVRERWAAQYLVYVVFVVVVVWLVRGVFPPGTVASMAAAIGFGSLAWCCIRNPFPGSADAIIRRTVGAAIITLAVINFHFYPKLLPYQTTIIAPTLARDAGVPANKLAFFNRSGPALDFYSGRMLAAMGTPAEVIDSSRSGEYWLYTDQPGRSRLDSAGVRYSIVVTMQHFEVALLTATFMNHRTRAAALTPVYLLRIRGANPVE